MDYQESRAFVAGAEKYGAVLGLTNERELLRRLGNPQDELKFVHVAGTNGKGSVIAYLYSVLRRAGYRVGRYTSPTLYSYRERMEVDGERISREAFAAVMTRVAEAVGEIVRDGLAHPTPFELETAAAFLFFAGQKCDLVLLEVGMGGDLDATNVIKNTVLAVLVSISMDHMAFLGNSLREIAEKKAGIIKPGCLAVTVRQEPEVAEVFETRCRELVVPLYVADAGKAVCLSESLEGQRFLYEGQEYQIPLAGACQIENAVLALECLRLLGGAGFPVSGEDIRKGLETTSWPGRFTVIHRKPLFVVDGAHNPGAAKQLAASIRSYFSGKKLYYIMGMFRDKDYRSVIRETASYAEKIFTIETPGNPRALPAVELAAVVREFHPNVQAAGSVREGVELAFQAAGEDDVILSFGSLSNIGEITEIVKNL